MIGSVFQVQLRLSSVDDSILDSDEETELQAIDDDVDDDNVGDDLDQSETEEFDDSEEITLTVCCLVKLSLAEFVAQLNSKIDKVLADAGYSTVDSTVEILSVSDATDSINCVILPSAVATQH